MRPRTRNTLAGGVAVASAIGGLVYLWHRRRSEPAEMYLLVPLDHVSLDEAEDDDAIGEAAGSIRRDFPAPPGGDDIGERERRVGPLLRSIPEGKRLYVDVQLIVPSLPATLPGASPSPCRATGARLLFGPNLNAIEKDYYQPADCEILRQTTGSDYDVHFPSYGLAKEPSGLWFTYVWIRFKHPQGPHYESRPHRLRLSWELVDA